MRDMEPETTVEGPMDGSEGDTPSTPGSTTVSGSEDAEYEKASFAVLLALVPLLVFTLFGQAGLL